MIGELRSLQGNADWQRGVVDTTCRVYLYASEKEYIRGVLCAAVSDGDVCIVLQYHNKLFHVLTSAGPGWITPSTLSYESLSSRCGMINT